MNVERNPVLPIIIHEDVKRLADVIHEIHCHWNHTDGCDWLYHSWERHEQTGGKLGYGRGEYARKAQAVVDVLIADGVKREDIDFDLLIAVFEAANSQKSYR